MEEIIEQINELSRAVLNCDSSSLTKDQVRFLIQADIASLPCEMTISTNDTRKTEVQYCTNSYGGSIRISLQSLIDHIHEELDTISSPVESLAKYLQYKKMYIQVMKFKYSSMESFLRSLSREAQIQDKIIPVGRYNK